LDAPKSVAFTADEVDSNAAMAISGTQDEALAAVLRGAGFADVTTWRDEDGDLRGLAARLPGFRAPNVS
jgi:hypothetical protein